MPYINEWDREQLDPDIRPAKVGELNFAVTKLAIEYILRNGGLSYTNVNDAIGALECAKMELYRRIAVPYEDVKIRENGDVYPEELL